MPVLMAIQDRGVSKWYSEVKVLEQISHNQTNEWILIFGCVQDAENIRAVFNTPDRFKGVLTHDVRLW